MKFIEAFAGETDFYVSVCFFFLSHSLGLYCMHRLAIKAM